MPSSRKAGIGVACDDLHARVNVSLFQGHAFTFPSLSLGQSGDRCGPGGCVRGGSLFYFVHSRRCGLQSGSLSAACRREEHLQPGGLGFISVTAYVGTAA